MTEALAFEPKRAVGPTNDFIPFEERALDRSIVDRFERIVDRVPDRLAIKTEDGALTYKELNGAANRAARAVQEGGLTYGQGRPRGRMAQREVEESPAILLLDASQGLSALIAVLGVLKAGKAYVPLDPSYPLARMTYMLEDSQAELIVTNAQNLSLASRMPHRDGKGRQVVNLDAVFSDRSLSDEDLGLPISPDAMAQILYTSGSTGQPKGVVHTHRTVLHHIRNQTNAYHLCADDRVMLLTSFSFGASTSDIFGALLNGAALYPFDLKRQGLACLADWLIRQEITIYHSMATTFRHFVEALTGEETFPRLRLINLGGETIYWQDVELYKKHFSKDCILRAGMAASETYSICWQFIGKDTEIAGDIVPVGRAVEGKEVLLLDEDRKPVGQGQVGEIAVRSKYLSPGYWRRPDLTQAAFRRMPDPGSGDERTYLTGDLGYMQADGCLVHLGRKDFQVKIRGYRVEVAEVEAALRNLDTVQEAVVVGRDAPRRGPAPTGGDKQLVAYLVPSIQPPPAVSTLRSALAERLPEYMIPSAFVFLDTLALTPTGKVDRQALPEPGQAWLGPKKPFAMPSTPTEEKLVEIWAELLGRAERSSCYRDGSGTLQPVGIHDSFFDLGGHSLLVMRLFARIEQIFGKRLPPSTIFQHPTVQQLAKVIQQEEGPPPWPTLVPIQPPGRQRYCAGADRRPFFCVHGFGGGVLGYVDLARLLGPEQPFYGLQARGLDGREEPHTRIEDMAAHYVEALRAAQPAGPYQLGGYCFGGVVAFEMARQLQARGEGVRLLAILEGYAPYRSRTRVDPWQPSVMASFVRNLPYWLRDYLPEGVRPMLARIRKHIRHARRGQRAGSERDAPAAGIAVEDVWADTSGLSEVEHTLMDTHLRALTTYQPGVYPGQLTLFRVRALRLFRAHDPEMGWGKLAAGGVKIYKIAGAHYSLLEKPHVEVLAKELKEALDQTQVAADSASG